MRVARFVSTLALILGAAPLALAADPPVTTIGSFRARPFVDPMTDAPRHMISTFDDETPGALKSLSWQCREDGLNLIFGWGKYLSGENENEIRVQMRFDSGKASDPLPWDLSGQNRSAFVPVPYVGDMTQLALRASTLTLRVEDGRDGERVTATFDLTGLRRALATLPCAAGVR